MQSKYYHIPLKLSQIMKGKHLDDEVELRKSIHQNIRLILKSITQTYSYDPNFGCIMDKFHALTPPQGISSRVWHDKMRSDLQKNFKDLLQKYETRIQVKDVFVEIKRMNSLKDKSMVSVEVEIKGNLSIGRKEKFHFPDSEVEEDAMEVLPLMIPFGKL